jgi:hypothetical protein
MRRVAGASEGDAHAGFRGGRFDRLLPRHDSPACHNVYLGLGFNDLGTVPMFVRMPA